ncbi:hypothetical protein LTR28_009613, partial [Elasticomyces elasticus]
MPGRPRHMVAAEAREEDGRKIWRRSWGTKPLLLRGSTKRKEGTRPPVSCRRRSRSCWTRRLVMRSPTRVVVAARRQGMPMRRIGLKEGGAGGARGRGRMGMSRVGRAKKQGRVGALVLAVVWKPLHY